MYVCSVCAVVQTVCLHLGEERNGLVYGCLGPHSKEILHPFTHSTYLYVIMLHICIFAFCSSLHSHYCWSSSNPLANIVHHTALYIGVLFPINGITELVNPLSMGDIFFIHECPFTGIFVSRGKITGRIRKIRKKILKMCHF